MDAFQFELAARLNRPPLLPDGKKAPPYRVLSDTIVPRGEMYENCRAAMRSGFPILRDAGPATEQPIVLVGNAPDLKKYVGAIGELKLHGAHIAAVKGAHDYLLEHGVVPDSAIATDPQPERARIFPRARFAFKRTQQDIKYYLGSQMHPSTWGRMRGLQVEIWHPAIDAMQKILPEWKGVRKVYGGSTTGLRAVSYYWIRGFRDFHLFGFGSHVEDGVLRATGEGCFADDQAFLICYAGRWFLTTIALAQQVDDLMPTLKECPDIRVHAYGDGPLPWVLQCGKRVGWPV